MLLLLHGTNAPCYSCSMTGCLWNDPTTTTTTARTPLPLWQPPSQERFSINMPSDSWNQYHPMIGNSLQQQRQRQSQLSYPPFEYRRRQQRGRPRVFRRSTHIGMTKYDEEKDTSRNYRYPILDNAGDSSTTVVVVSVVTGGLLLAFGSLEMWPSFLVVVTTTITLFLVLRTIARTLILNDDDSDDGELLTDHFEADDDPVVPIQWQIDGTTLILSYFISALLIPSDITSPTTASNGNEIAISDATTTMPSVLLVAASLVGLGIWFNINIVRPTIEKERELTLSSFTEILFHQWDQKFRRYLQQQEPPKNKTNGEKDD